VRASLAAAATAVLLLGGAACGSDDDDDDPVVTTVVGGDTTTPGTAPSESENTEPAAGGDQDQINPENETDPGITDTTG